MAETKRGVWQSLMVTHTIGKKKYIFFFCLQIQIKTTGKNKMTYTYTKKTKRFFFFAEYVSILCIILCSCFFSFKKTNMILWREKKWLTIVLFFIWLLVNMYIKIAVISYAFFFYKKGDPGVRLLVLWHLT